MGKPITGITTSLFHGKRTSLGRIDQNNKVCYEDGCAKCVVLSYPPFFEVSSLDKEGSLYGMLTLCSWIVQCCTAGIWLL